ncbi:MAG: hypothetical protein V1853_03070 [bacterium]
MLIAFLILIVIISFIPLVFALNALFSLFRDKVPYVPTPNWAVEWLAANLDLKAGEVVYDLGCGDGRILKALKKNYPDIRAIGYERGWWPFLLAKWNTRGTGVEIRFANFYQADLSDGDVIFCFLIHSVMAKVKNNLQSQLKPGSQVYSFGFRFPDWQPAEEYINPKKPEGSKLRLYKT